MCADRISRCGLTAHRSRWLPGPGFGLLLSLIPFLGAVGHVSADVLVRGAFYSRRYDHLSTLDSRPQSHGEIGGRVETMLILAQRWGIGVGAEAGGDRFDFGGPLVSGTGEDWSWTGWLSVDRFSHPMGWATAYAGAQVFYGESGSKLRSLQVYIGTQVTPGPENFMTGGAVRVGVSAPVFGPLETWAELGMRVYRGRGTQPLSEIAYRWIGRSEVLVVGLQLRLCGSRPAQEPGDQRDH